MVLETTSAPASVVGRRKTRCTNRKVVLAHLSKAVARPRTPTNNVLLDTGAPAQLRERINISPKPSVHFAQQAFVTSDSTPSTSQLAQFES